jgi:TolB-like protein/DNA-binding winged helix-turn-helix (wHTH) protein/Tfp pilus assembly protein PilF
MPTPVSKYSFGPFEVRTKTRELYKHGVRLKLRPQAYQVLVFLLDRGGDVVTREELQKRVWPSNTFVDFEHGLNTAIKELRGKLSDSASEPRYIETLPKLGYRMIETVKAEAEIEIASSVGKVSEASVTTGQAKPPDGNAKGFGSWGKVVALTTGVLAIAIVLVFVKWNQPKPQPAPQKVESNERMMLAVLPFENLTGEEAQDYFSDGLTEEMIAQLGRLDPKEFGVIARTSVMHYKHTTAKVDQISRELGVRYVLEGSVRRDPTKVRINARLIEAGTQTPLWTKEYDRELTNLLTVQAEIAHEISDEIQLTLGKPAGNTPVSKPVLTPEAYQAYDLYLKGLFFWNKRTGTGFEQAIKYFQQAIEKDPNYAPAYAGLANSYTLQTSYSLALPSKYMPKARAAALRAVKLDDSLPEAHVALAIIVENYDYDWDTAEKEYRRAIALNPNYATARQWYAEMLTWQGRFEEALKESEEARRLDPLSLIIATDQASLFYYSGQYDQAIEKYREVLELDPEFLRAHQIIDAYIEKGKYAEALADSENASKGLADSPGRLSKRSYTYCRAGQMERAKEDLAKLEAENLKQALDPSALVLPNLCVGNKERALAMLEKAYAQHSNAMTRLKVDPAYEPLKNERRFQELLHKVGLGQ